MILKKENKGGRDRENMSQRNGREKGVVGDNGGTYNIMDHTL